MAPTTPNPDTHCTSCGEPLSIYSHCWQCEYPPMDPALDKAPNVTWCDGKCGVCLCISSPSTATATESNV